MCVFECDGDRKSAFFFRCREIKSVSVFKIIKFRSTFMYHTRSSLAQQIQPTVLCCVFLSRGDIENRVFFRYCRDKKERFRLQNHQISIYIQLYHTRSSLTRQIQPTVLCVCVFGLRRLENRVFFRYVEIKKSVSSSKSSNFDLYSVVFKVFTDTQIQTTVLCVEFLFSHGDRKSRFFRKIINKHRYHTQRVTKDA